MHLGLGKCSFAAESIYTISITRSEILHTRAHVHALNIFTWENQKPKLYMGISKKNHYMNMIFEVHFALKHKTQIVPKNRSPQQQYACLSKRFINVQVLSERFYHNLKGIGVFISPPPYPPPLFQTSFLASFTPKQA